MDFCAFHPVANRPSYTSFSSLLRLLPKRLLIHGFGVDSVWQWSETVKILVLHFNIYVPDLVFFCESYTTQPKKVRIVPGPVREAGHGGEFGLENELRRDELRRVRGVQYGGAVQGMCGKVVICCAGVCLEEKDIKNGLFPVNDVDVAADILLPETAETMRELLRYAFVKPPKALPSCLLNDFIDEMEINGISGSENQ
ncbi:OLC1v1022395C1 [Oldenlandia corymbosa var. corymbosa]|uniref:OLC1v1022395C1 n=1 Tax=Oldenlandia corymbosa var. corymbosa TaxID=529605 RepID=A0AAV1BXY1_OLDCO|nr:OLC1v1022395C1 [Oldenlandia corymbosa var. corymbosa]